MGVPGGGSSGTNHEDDESGGRPKHHVSGNNHAGPLPLLGRHDDTQLSYRRMIAA
jgi:hypothetical protein